MADQPPDRPPARTRVARRAWRLVAFAAAAVVISFAFVTGYVHFAPRTHFTPTELRAQEQNAAKGPRVSHDPTAADESSTSEHFASLRDGARAVWRHPWGYGLGNAGVTAERTDDGVVADLDGVGRAAALQALVSAGVAVEQFTPRRRLEDAFLALVGEGPVQ